LRRWLHDAELAVDGPPRFIRFRKAVTAAEALAHPSRYLRDTRRHGAATFFGHYANSPVLRAHAGQLFLDAVSDHFSAAVRAPTVITREAEAQLANQPESDLVDAVTAQALLRGELDGPHTACRNPLESPFAPPGEVCQLSATGTCFGCSN